ncbi:YbjN domain-containing protein [Paractinoplanes atraurantiacus]|uniref:Putative sensory transduction regulator n=1 Tax=Paractinoplanes atraurantiacus TaxID=1036182 RepID=A0A285H5T2_9ACTN|nr:YbjN domain-containing protein [Actinoplanes atraurantiacus]SNY31142.1 Putative sensory transduction regulator [Actinoplanes atraurantiacus]
MPWWSWRPGSAAGNPVETDDDSTVRSAVRVGVPAQREPGRLPVPADTVASEEPETVAPVTLTRIGKALDLLDIRFLADGGGSLLAMWERHAVLFTLEGPDDEILVMRARPHSTVPPDWADRAYRVVNEWNHTRRFCKAYVGDPTERGQLPIYAELQVPLAAGTHDALLVELLDCGAAVATSFVDWLHDEGALL